MENYKLLDGISNDVLQKCAIKEDKEKVVETLSIWLEMQLFKMISIIYIMCKHEDQNKATGKILNKVKEMFKLECKRSSKKVVFGGMGNPYMSGAMYSSNAGTDVQQINLGGDIRNEIAATMGGGIKKVKYDSKISKVLSLHTKYFDIAISKEVRSFVINLLVKEIQCVHKDTAKIKNVTVKKLSSVLSKHNVFH